MKRNLKIWSITLAISFLASVTAWAQSVSVVVSGGVRCPVDPRYCEINSTSLPVIYGSTTPSGLLATGTWQGVLRSFDLWCVRNATANDIFIPTGTFAEFQSFIENTTANPIPGLTVEPCCDPTLCPSHSELPGPGDCSACINEGWWGPGNCCDWACPGIGDVITTTGNPCCQSVATPSDPMVGGVCQNTCVAGDACQAWENTANCCINCRPGGLSDPICGDNFCCGAAPLSENVTTCCSDCEARSDACENDAMCCAASGEDANGFGCFECQVCGDDICTPGVEDSDNCCFDCDCAAGETCMPPSPSGTCGCEATVIDNCDLPLTASGDTAGSCAPGTSGSCNYTCNNGWVENANSCCPDSNCGDGCCGENENHAVCAADCDLAWCNPEPGYRVDGRPAGGGPTECDRGGSCPAWASPCWDPWGLDRDYTCENPRTAVAPQCCRASCRAQGYTDGVCGGDPGNADLNGSYSCNTDRWGSTWAGASCWCTPTRCTDCCDCTDWYRLDPGMCTITSGCRVGQEIWSRDCTGPCSDTDWCRDGCTSCRNGVQDGEEEGVDCGPVCGNVCASCGDCSSDCWQECNVWFTSCWDSCGNPCC